LPIDTDCDTPPPVCGDFVIDPGEQCDSDVWGSVVNCIDLGFANGSVTCNPQGGDKECLFNVSLCEVHPGCPPKKRMCADGLCKKDCGGNELPCSLDEVCQDTESCNCHDCWGWQDSCQPGLICYNNSLCEDPDVLPEVCEFWDYPAKNETQGICDEQNERGCWVEDSKRKECCGNDEDENNAWLDMHDNFCCQGEYHFNTTPPDESSCVCTSWGVNPKREISPIKEINYCDQHGDEFCYDTYWPTNVTIIGRSCCGDVANETWQHSTEENIEETLPEVTCSEGKWYNRTQSGGLLTIYDMWTSGILG